MNLATRLPFSPFARLPSSPRTPAYKFNITSSQVRITTEPVCSAPAACGRRELVILTAIAAAPARAEEEVQVEEEKVKNADTTITDRVFLDIAMCPTTFRPERSSAAAAEEERAALVCAEAEPLGRIVIGVYGKQVPRTVANFRAMCTGAAGATYEGSLIHKVFPGQYLMAGKQGRKEKGEVPSPTNLERNLETVEAGAFRLRHVKPGTVSLCLSENDDEDEYKLSPDYRNVEFLITTGPGPCPQLDNKNIVFGTVLEG
jgi:peptidyl-prolyl cis-trans isomerase B (cyclophilin B)